MISDDKLQKIQMSSVCQVPRSTLDEDFFLFARPMREVGEGDPDKQVQGQEGAKDATDFQQRDIMTKQSTYVCDCHSEGCKAELTTIIGLGTCTCTGTGRDRRF